MRSISVDKHTTIPCACTSIKDGKAIKCINEAYAYRRATNTFLCRDHFITLIERNPSNRKLYERVLYDA
jgi:hypothetical protein